MKKRKSDETEKQIESEIVSNKERWIRKWEGHSLTLPRHLLEKLREVFLMDEKDKYYGETTAEILDKLTYIVELESEPITTCPCVFSNVDSTHEAEFECKYCKVMFCKLAMESSKHECTRPQDPPNSHVQDPKTKTQTVIYWHAKDPTKSQVVIIPDEEISEEDREMLNDCESLEKGDDNYAAICKLGIYVFGGEEGDDGDGKWFQYVHYMDSEDFHPNLLKNTMNSHIYFITLTVDDYFE